MAQRYPRTRYDDGAIYDGPVDRQTTMPVETPIPLETPALDPPPPAPYQAKGPALNLEGFDNQKLAGGHISPKYVFAKHAQGLGMSDTDELLRRLQGDESGYFKNSRFDGDKLIVDGALDPKFGGINTFDVIRGSKGGGEGWQWIDPNNATGGAPLGGRSGGNPLGGLLGMPGGSDILQALLAESGMGGMDLNQQIQAELQKLLTGQ